MNDLAQYIILIGVLVLVGAIVLIINAVLIDDTRKALTLEHKQWITAIVEVIILTGLNIMYIGFIAAMVESI